MPNGLFNPETSVPDTVNPEVVYSPIDPAPAFKPAKLSTKRSDPDTAMPSGSVNPDEIKVPVPTVTPAVVYSLIDPLPPVMATKISEPDTAMPDGLSNPDTSEVFTVDPEVVYSPINPVPGVVLLLK